MMRISAVRSRSGGSTLLISLWALLLLSAVVFGWAKWINHQLDAYREESLGLEAYALALSGLAVAQHQFVHPGSPVLSADLGHERGYEVSIKGEGGKINLLYYLRDEDPVRREFISNYLYQHGLTLEERDTLIDGVLDWMDADSLRRPHGAEESEHYKPANRPLTSLEELPLIHGTAPLIRAHPNWRDDFTLYSTRPIDLKTAPAHLITLIPGVDEKMAEAFVVFRAGDDGIDGTPDDPPMANLAAALAQLGLPVSDLQSISSLVGYNDNTIRIRSTGRAGEVDRQIEVVARRSNNATRPEILIRFEP